MTEVLYSPQQLINLSWPDTCQYQQAYLLPFSSGAQRFIANVATQMQVLRIGEHFFPVTVNDSEYESSYVCSPYTACISYAKEELSKLHNKPLETGLKLLITAVGKLLRAVQINKVVSVNNWLLSTNLYPDWQGAEIQSITQLLTQQFPEHSIMFRSLNHHSNAALLKAFKAAGYHLLPSRQVYLFDKQRSDYWQYKNTRCDFALLDKTPYTVVDHDDITMVDYPRIVMLYKQLYLDKYSYHNPQFTVECIQLWHQQKLLYMQGLRNSNGLLDGIVGCFERNMITTAPLVGYDTQLPRQLGLYRMLMALVIKRAYNHDLMLNLSSGASQFKRLRGGMPEIEYSAVYTAHLSTPRKAVWKILESLLTHIGVPLMKKYQL